MDLKELADTTVKVSCLLPAGPGMEAEIPKREGTRFRQEQQADHPVTQGQSWAQIQPFLSSPKPFCTT